MNLKSMRFHHRSMAMQNAQSMFMYLAPVRMDPRSRCRAERRAHGSMRNGKIRATHLWLLARNYGGVHSHYPIN